MRIWHSARYAFIISVSLGSLVVLFQNCSKTNFSKQQSVHAPKNVVKNGCITGVDCVEEDPDDKGKDIGGPSDPDHPFGSPLPPHSDLDAPTEVSVQEDDGTAVIEYAFDEVLTETKTFSVKIKGKTATADEDFNPNIISTITVLAGESDFSIRVPIINDDLWDVTDESLYIELSDSKNSSVTMVTIIDDEPFPAITLRQSFFDDPQKNTPNALIFSHSPDQKLTISLRSDATEDEATENICNTNTSQVGIAIPGTNYEPVQATEVTLDAHQLESSEFMTQWLDLPGGNQFAICYHLLEIW